ncbi:hypothetical protein AB0N09_37990 [Streptomyces erythrochromogenes]|uniref:hypothetical protein n=1 Tax=Streptomyces erythrochromogenes TaxID=285574 RepID=UPI00341BDA02
MEATEQTAEGFGRLVAAAREKLGRMRDESLRYAVEHTRTVGDGHVRFLVEGDAVADACEAYLEGIGRAATDFLAVCDDVVRLQEGLTRDVDLAFGVVEDPGTAGNRHMVFEALDAPELGTYVREAAGRYAHDLEGIQQRFRTAWAALETEYEVRLDVFKGVVAGGYGIAVDVLDLALLVGRGPGVAAAVAVLAGYDPCAVVFVCSVIGALIVADELIGVADAASAVYDFLDEAWTKLR